MVAGFYLVHTRTFIMLRLARLWVSSAHAASFRLHLLPFFSTKKTPECLFPGVLKFAFCWFA